MNPLIIHIPEMPPEKIARIEAETLALIRPADLTADALEPSPPQEEQLLQIMPNDSEHARQFVGVHGHLFRYVSETGTWLIWNDAVGWVPGREADVLEIARDYVDAQIKASMKAVEGAEDDTISRALSAAAKYGNAPKLNALILLTRADPKIIIPIKDVDSDLWQVGVGNGSIDLTKGAFHAPDHSRLITKRLGCDFNPSATCPVWEKFLAKVQPDPAHRAFLRRWAGYCLTGSTAEQKFLFFYGAGSNGKSTFLETLLYLFGGYAQGAPETLVASNPHGNKPGAELARLPGTRFLLGCEIGEGMRLNESLVKSIVSGDTVTGEAKYCSPFDFNPVAKLNLFGNYRPVVSGTDHGFWRRVMLVPWQVQIGEDEKDESLRDRLRSELPGILNWCLAGLDDWRSAKLRPPPSIEAATAEYKSASDILGEFIADHLDITATGCKLPLGDAYKRYREWATDCGIRLTWSARTFNSKMEDHGFSRGKSNGSKFWKDIGWRPEF